MCDVCLGEDDAENDEIVICDICYVGVHQQCHGGKIKDSLPHSDEPFYCERCEYLLKNKQKTCLDIECVYCPDFDGALKQV